MAATALPHVLILGGGFGGLCATRALASAPVRVTLVDRRNHHLFSPLLYQVATAGLSAPDIAAPIRPVLRPQRHTTARPPGGAARGAAGGGGWGSARASPRAGGAARPTTGRSRTTS